MNFPVWHDTRVDAYASDDKFPDTSWQVLETEGHVKADEIGFGPGRSVSRTRPGVHAAA